MFVGLSLIGVPYALLLALVAGILRSSRSRAVVFRAHRYFCGVPRVSGTCNFALIFYTVIQQIENHVLVPLFMKKITGLNPVVVIVALLVGAKLGGIMGMLIAGAAWRRWEELGRSRQEKGGVSAITGKEKRR